MTKIFISYSKKDPEYTWRLANELQKKGYTVWWDTDSLVPGDDFQREIEKAIDNAKAVIVIWTQKSWTSEWVRFEATRGYTQKKLITTHISGFDLSSLPVPFNRLHSELVDNLEKVESALAKLDISPSQAEMLTPAVLSVAGGIVSEDYKSASDIGAIPNIKTRRTLRLSRVSQTHVRKPTGAAYKTEIGWNALLFFTPLLLQLLILAISLPHKAVIHTIAAIAVTVIYTVTYPRPSVSAAAPDTFIPLSGCFIANCWSTTNLFYAKEWCPAYFKNIAIGCGYVGFAVGAIVSLLWYAVILSLHNNQDPD